MKSQTNIILSAVAAIVIFGGFGCAKESSSGGSGGGDTGVNNPAATPTPVPTPTPTPTPGIGDPFAGMGGATIEITPTSIATWNEYVALHPVNAPTGFRINVQLQDIGGDSVSNQNPSTHRYAGTVRVAYFDNGTWYVTTFESGFGTNQVSYQNRTTGRQEATFNHWYQLGGVDVFHGFFQDQYGAIVFVVDGVGGVDQGDGQAVDGLKGSIYFKNFPTGYATQSPEKCWFIRVGPYDCRTFLLNNSSDRSERDIWSFSNPVTPSASDGYKKLGTFTGLSKSGAFQ